jgi:hypothetical protein
MLRALVADACVVRDYPDLENIETTGDDCARVDRGSVSSKDGIKENRAH